MMAPAQEQGGDQALAKKNTPGAKPQGGKRKALGELTNTPLLLSPGGLNNVMLTPGGLHSPRAHTLNSPSSLMAPPENISTPPKTMPSSPDTITPTHNLKLLTELASKMSGTTSTARQTLQFEDVDPNRYTSEPIYLPSLQAEAPSPHRDHPYGVKSKAASKLVSENQFRDEFVVVEPMDTKAKTKAVVGKTKQVKPQTPTYQSPSSELFAPPAEKGANRKEKSLGLLAERMLGSLPYNVSSGESLELQLDDTARALQTERRRIYDIVNVFEAVQIMSKVGKNVYQWHGRTFLNQSLAWLRQLAIKLGMVEQYNVAREQEMQMMIHNQENVNIENVSPGTPLTPTFSPMASPSPLNSPLMSPYNSPNDPNGTSMGINTQKFLMLFLVTPQPQTLTLDFAARVIHGMQQVEKARLTRIRRLYDIANILQSLGLIRKVQVTDGRGKKPAFQFIGPDVSELVLTEDEKKQMPATRQKNSLLAVGRNLALLPDKDTTSQTGKRARSLSEERKGGVVGAPAKLVRTRSESRVNEGSGTSASLFDLSEVCEIERQKLENIPTEVQPGDTTSQLMKPPTPGRPPSRKKHLLQRYYSDSALLSTSQPRAQSPQARAGTNQPLQFAPQTTQHGSVSVTKIQSPISPSNYKPLHSINKKPSSSAIAAHTFTSPRPVVNQSSPRLITLSSNNQNKTAFGLPSPRQGNHPIHMSPISIPHVVPKSISIQSPNSPRTASSQAVPQSPRPTYSPLHPSPLTRSSPQTVPVSERHYTPMRSPITPRDLRNSSILPPNSPTRSKLLTCSPMGPVGRSLLSSPASPRAPIDLTTRPSRIGRSPLASRSLNLPPTPPEKNTSKTHSLLKANVNENSSPLLRAYLANNQNRIFKPILSSGATLEEGVSILPLDGAESSAATLSPSTSISTLSLLSSPATSTVSSPVSSARSSPPPTISPDGSTNSSSASELEGIFGKPLSRPTIPISKMPQAQVSKGTPIDFSGLLSAPPKSQSSTPFSILSLNSPFLNSPHDLSTPHMELHTPTQTTPTVTIRKYNERT